jgi:NADH-quinone oxidoreductase subunit H
MKFGWKVLIPFSLIWILIVSTLRVLSQQGAPRSVLIGFSFGMVLLVLAGSSLFESSKKRRAREDALGEVDSPSFPVPAIPGNNLKNRTEQING